jgi:hypothetical protein
MLITYKPASGSNVTFRVFIDAPNSTAAGNLAVDLNGAAGNLNGTIDSGVPFWLKLGDTGDRLVSVNFDELGITCGLTAGKSEIHIYQSTKH